jgi:hypothetical protein
MGLILWWVSATFVLIAVAYFGRKLLNQTMAVVLLVLYTSISYAMVHMVFLLGLQQSHLARYLSSLDIQPGWTYSLIDNVGNMQLTSSFFIALVIMFAGAFLAGVGSLIMCMYRRSENQDSNVTAQSGRDANFKPGRLMTN